MCFLKCADTTIYDELMERLHNGAYVGWHKYPVTTDVAYDLLLRRSGKFTTDRRKALGQWRGQGNGWGGRGIHASLLQRDTTNQDDLTPVKYGITINILCSSFNKRGSLSSNFTRPDHF